MSSQDRVPLHLDQHIPIFNFDGINGQLGLRITFERAGRRVVLPTVPGTYDLTAFDVTLPQRAAHVQADVFYGTTSSVDIRDADCCPIDFKFLGFARCRQFRLSREFCVGHVFNKLRLSVGCMRICVNSWRGLYIKGTKFGFTPGGRVPAQTYLAS